jgi:hypothetical protein
MSANKVEVEGLKFMKVLVWIVYALASAAAIILAFAFFLLLLDASTKSSFVEFIYSWGKLFAQPFVGMLESTKLANGGVISWSALFAIAAYSVVAWIVGGALNAISRSIYHARHVGAVTSTAGASQATAVAQPETPEDRPADKV